MVLIIFQSNGRSCRKSKLVASCSDTKVQLPSSCDGGRSIHDGWGKGFAESLVSHNTEPLHELQEFCSRVMLSLVQNHQPLTAPEK